MVIAATNKIPLSKANLAGLLRQAGRVTAGRRGFFKGFDGRR
jgi:hypothetical protein